jgi:hypothetical protein
MPAILILDEDQISRSLPLAIEQIRCPLACGASYTIYSSDPVTTRGTETSVDAMRRMAAAKVDRGHPDHCTKEFYWKGSEQGWCESDIAEQWKKL